MLYIGRHYSGYEVIGHMARVYCWTSCHSEDCEGHRHFEALQLKSGNTEMILSNFLPGFGGRLLY